MRKLFLLAGAVVAMASCAKTEIEDLNPGNSDAIIVGANVGAQSTKGTIFDKGSIQESGFGIMAYYTAQHNWNDYSGYIPDFMYNQKVEYSEITLGWSYSPLKYWPNDKGDKISFFAYAPYPNGENGKCGDNGVNGEYTTVGSPQIEFELACDAEDMVDFVAGQNIDMERQKSRLTFNMKHQLTRVQFSAITSNNNGSDENSFIVVRSMEIVDSPELFTKGVYTYDNETTNSYYSDHAQDGSWSLSDPVDSYSLESVLGDDQVNIEGYAESGVVLPIEQTKAVSLFADGEYLFLLPPAGADGVSEDGIKIEVVYDVVKIDDQIEDGYTVTTITNRVSLPVGTMVQGKAYNYQLNFEVTDFLVDPNNPNVDWDDDTSDGGGVVDPFIG